MTKIVQEYDLSSPTLGILDAKVTLDSLVKVGETVAMREAAKVAILLDCRRCC